MYAGIKPVLNEHLAKLQQDFNKNKTTHGRAILRHLENFIAERPDKDFTYIHISWLRSSYVVEKRMIYCIEGFTKNWYYDQDVCSKEISYDWLLFYLLAFEKEVDNFIDQNMHIDRCHRRTILMECFPYFQAYITESVVSILDAISLDRPINLYMGEYHGRSRLIYTGLTTRPDFHDLIMQPEHYMCQRLEQLIVHGEIAIEKTLSFMIFYQCQFVDCDFSGTTFYGSRFIECEFQNCSFEAANIQDAIFWKSEFHSCNFRSVQGNGSYHGLRFTNCDLNRCDFRFALLQGADFTGTSFADCLMDAYLVDSLALNKAQITTLSWQKSVFWA